MRQITASESVSKTMTAIRRIRNCNHLVPTLIPLAASVFLLAAAAADCRSWLGTTRCQLRCLDALQHSTLEDSNAATGMRLCTENATCSSCLIPCSEDDLEQKQCGQICENGGANVAQSCTDSCEFVTNVTRHATTVVVAQTVRTSCDGGEVHQDGTSTWPPAANERHHQLVTEHLQCSHDAGSYEFHQISINEVWETRGIHVRWKVREIPCCVHGRIPSTIFVVQMRQLIGHKTNNWTVLTTTMSKSLNLVNILSLGLRYQLRIVAMSSAGVKNVSMDSEPFGLAEDIPVPGPPRDVRFKHPNGGTLSLTLQWDRPHDSMSVPVSHYMVSWQREEENRSRPDDDFTEPHNSVVLPGHVHSYRLVNIEPTATYTIKIQGIVKLGEKLLIGEAATLRVHSVLQYISSEHSTTVRTVPSQQANQLDPAPVENVTVNAPFYRHGALHAPVTWNYKNELRSTVQRFMVSLRIVLCDAMFDHLKHNATDFYVDSGEFHFDLTNLHFECTYEVVVKVVSVLGFHASSPPATFRTPPCYNVTVRYEEDAISSRPSCPRHAPQNFVCLATNSREDTRICRWDVTNIVDKDVPLHPPSHLAYLFLARPFTPHHNLHHGGSQFWKNAAVRRILDKDEHKTVLHDLVPNSKYHVTIRAVGANGMGPDAHAHFHVPNYYAGRASHQTAHHTWQKSESNQLSMTSALLSVLSTLLFAFNSVSFPVQDYL